MNDTGREYGEKRAAEETAFFQTMIGDEKCAIKFAQWFSLAIAEAFDEGVKHADKQRIAAGIELGLASRRF